MEKCSGCKATEELTKEHPVPLWLLKKIHLMGIDIPRRPMNGILCKKCNIAKGGRIDYSIPIVKRYMETIAHSILRECTKQTERDRLLDGVRIKVRIVSREEGVLEEAKEHESAIIKENE